MERTRVAVSSFQPSPDTATLIRLFDATLWNDLEFSGILELVSRSFYPLTTGAAPHDWLQNMGGSIGYGMPVATGAAIACPDRKVLAFIGDGSGMYTVQALWTMAREGLDITVVIWANRTYQILKGEFNNNPLC